MAIAISTNFDIQTGLPLDSRQRVETLTERNAIDETLRYEGLKTYVVETATTYVLKGGITDDCWVAENVVTNDMIESLVDTTATTGKAWGYIPYVKTDGGIELGQYIDFHLTSADGIDRTARIRIYNDDGTPRFKLEGSSSGSLAHLTVQNITASQYHGTYYGTFGYPLKITLNGTQYNYNGNSANATTCAEALVFYAPTIKGTQGYILLADEDGTPIWTDTLPSTTMFETASGTSVSIAAFYAAFTSALSTLQSAIGKTSTVEASETNGNLVIDSVETVVYEHPTTAGYKHIPSGGESGQILAFASDGAAKWITADCSIVGLDYVDNTADLDKPVSTKQQAAIDAALEEAKAYADTAAESDRPFKGVLTDTAGFQKVLAANEWKAGWNWIIGCDMGEDSLYASASAISAGSILIALLDAPEETVAVGNTPLVETYFQIIEISTAEDSLIERIATLEGQLNGLTFYVDDDGNVVVTSESGETSSEVTEVEDGTITTLKLANGSVTTVKIASGAITENKISDGAVTGTKIATGAVSEDKLSDALLERLKTIESTLTAQGETITSLNTTIDSLNSTINSQAEKIASLTEEIETLKGQLNGITFGVDDDGNLTATKEE